MQKNERISNLYVNNRFFSEYLCDKGFILPSDSIIEVTDYIPDSVSIYLDNAVKSIFLGSANWSDVERSFNYPFDNKNFVCNGVFPSVDSYISRVLKTGAFNVGICTSDLKDYHIGKEAYKKLYGKLVALGIPVLRVEEKLEDGRVYLLSYRTWKWKR